MATITPTVFPSDNRLMRLEQWANMKSGDIGASCLFAHFSAKCIQVIGTLDGAHVVLQGSLDGYNFAPLNDYQNKPLDFVQPGIRVVVEAPVHIRPVVTGGTALTNVTVLLCLKGLLCSG